MLFNSINFAIFFIIVYALYLVLSHKWQNRMLLVASCVFYGFWDWRFLSLLFITIVVDYFVGLKIYALRDTAKKKSFVALSIVVNLGILGFFKYFNFFSESLRNLLHLFGYDIGGPSLNIILPVGISFYTFQSMSYAIDIYRGKLVPTRNFLDFSLFVTYFPQLVAGPIERASHLLPQILFPRKMTLEKFYEGSYLIFWGLFQKVFVADNLAKIVDPVFAAGPPYNGVNALIALYAFAFQIFCDFAGYSNIARGLGKCMGFDIMVNFNLPYFATNPSDFWKRWHISLSTWLRDYLYIPLGGNQKGTLLTYRNLALTMFLGGLWHGAAWTFVIWGTYHGVLLIIHRLLRPWLEKMSRPKSAIAENIWFYIRLTFFFHLVCIGWLFFRAQSATQAIEMLRGLLFNFNFARGMSIKCNLVLFIFYVWLLFIVQFLQFIKNDLMVMYKSDHYLKPIFYFICFYSMLLYGVTGGKEFIYFQF